MIRALYLLNLSKKINRYFDKPKSLADFTLEMYHMLPTNGHMH